MKNVIIVGYGRMGKQVEQRLKDTEGMECVGIIEPKDVELYDGLEQQMKTLSSQGQKIDVIIDFSHPYNLDKILRFAENHTTALMLATTGYTEIQVESIKNMSKKIPIVYTPNLSIGVTVMTKVLNDLSVVLKDDYDIEIIEKHHNQKIDAPSGTAIMLADTVDPDNKFKRNYGRQGHGKRDREIGIHAIRGGSIAGEHTVIFAGDNEILEITHKAESRQIFANGAVRAAGYVAGKAPGLYNMNDVLFG